MKFAYIFEPPFNYRDGKGQVCGHDVEVARHVAAALGTVFEPVETTFPKMLAGLADGHWEMTTGLFETPERQKHAAFTQPIWALGDGLLVAKGNPLSLSGYASLAAHPTAKVAAIHGQIQVDRALHCGLPPDRLRLFDDYTDAAQAVRDGHAQAYASVARAHTRFLEQHSGWDLDCLPVPPQEAPPALGAFAVALGDTGWLREVNACLSTYIGAPAHRAMAVRYGFSDADIDACLA